MNILNDNMVQYRGKVSLEDVEFALDKTRMRHNNRIAVTMFLVNGYTYNDLPCSKQQALPRVKRVIQILRDEGILE